MLVSLEVFDDSMGVWLRDGRVNQHLATVSFSRGTLQNGVISDAEQITKQVKNLLTAEHAKVRECEFLLPTSSVLTKEVELPKVSNSRLMPLLKSQMEATMPDIANYVLDYIEFVPEDEKTRSLLAVMLPVRLMEQYLSLADRLELKCKAVQIRFARLRERVLAAGLGNGSAYIVMDMMPGETELCLFEGDKVFVRTVELASHDSTLSDWGITFATAGPDNLDKSRQLYEMIHSLVQFQAGRNREAPVGAIYAVGELEKHAEILSGCSELLGNKVIALTEDMAAPDSAAAEEVAG